MFEEIAELWRKGPRAIAALGDGPKVLLTGSDWNGKPVPRRQALSDYWTHGVFGVAAPVISATAAAPVDLTPLCLVVGDPRAFYPGSGHSWKTACAEAINGGILQRLQRGLTDGERLTDRLDLTKSHPFRKFTDAFIARLPNGPFTPGEWNVALQETLNEYKDTDAIKEDRVVAMLSHSKRELESALKITRAVKPADLAAHWQKTRGEAAFTQEQALAHFAQGMKEKGETQWAAVDDQGRVVAMGIPMPGTQANPLAESIGRIMGAPPPRRPPPAPPPSDKGGMAEMSGFLESHQAPIIGIGAAVVLLGVVTGGIALPLLGGLAVVGGLFGKQLLGAVDEPPPPSVNDNQANGARPPSGGAGLPSGGHGLPRQASAVNGKGR